MGEGESEVEGTVQFGLECQLHVHLRRVQQEQHHRNNKTIHAACVGRCRKVDYKPMMPRANTLGGNFFQSHASNHPIPPLELSSPLSHVACPFRKADPGQYIYAPV